jgi:hypothetical protein
VFSTQTGSVALYGLLAVLPEFIVVLTYTIIGVVLPLDKDVETNIPISSGPSQQWTQPQYAPLPTPGSNQNNPSNLYSYPPQGMR